MTLVYPPRQRQIQQLTRKFGLPERSFIRWDLLDLALTHPTAHPEQNYERLEFVGDAVVRLAVAEFLWETFSNSSVGDFSAVRSILVSDRVLAEISESYGLERYLLLSTGATNDRAGRCKRMADALEAILAALYLSTHTLELIRPWLDPHWKKRTTEILRDPARQNYKAALQEWTQARYKSLPEYRVKELQPVHGDPHRFHAEAWVLNQRFGCGSGRSIKAAEQRAAQEAFFAVQARSPEEIGQIQVNNPSME